MSTIGLCMIVKDEQKVLEQCIESVKSIVDEYFIVDTGSTDGTKEIIKKYGKVFEIPFVDYVTTKNEALKLCTSDYILFMDSDEVVTEGLQFLKEHADTGTNCVDGFIVEGLFDGVAAQSYVRARLWKNSGDWKFAGPFVHEVLVSSGNSTTMTDHRIKILHTHAHKTQESNNIKFRGYVDLLKRYLEEHPKDGRALFYLGRTYKDLGQWLDAIEFYRKYLELNVNFRDEKWQAAYDEAVCWKQLGEYNQVFKACDLAESIDPQRADVHTLRGDIYYGLQEWNEAVKWFEKAASLPVPTDVVLFLNPREHFETPLDRLVLITDKLKDYRKCHFYSKRLADKLSKPDTRIVNNLTWLNKMQYKNIFFALGNTPEPVYGGMIDKTGVGGVESTYIELSKELAKRGHNCFLFCNCEKEHVYEGVYYVPYYKMGENLVLNPEVIITSRWYDALYVAPLAKKIIWAQDNFYTDPNHPDAFASCNALVCSSQWHRYHLAHLLGEGLRSEKTNIIPLSIRGELFKGKNIVRDPLKVIYSSNPNRGLDVLSVMWEELSNKIPGIHLSIMYGWEGLRTWSNDSAWIASVEKDKERIEKWAEKAGNVTITGRLTKARLAEEMLSASLCLYPSTFWETFCLTALETQAAGTPMITTKIGALSNTLNNESNILVDKNPSSKEYRDEFVQTVAELMENKEKFSALSENCISYFNKQLTWEQVAVAWENLIYGI